MWMVPAARVSRVAACWPGRLACTTRRPGATVRKPVALAKARSLASGREPSEHGHARLVQ